ncbi:cysteine-rich CWC family protein [Mucilaginibacter segetis]|uniref:Cysteine-rich CWC family protein n=1 Tax=Mucilaginibacter segetis TaxID=2793071 RepID=A0A934PW36_9SPHI|nr:cysteine-rich CWC family protein [Mucilaginibacter segetis]MBK0380742.1 cysteine-rich CWC family protein [Mucilaginibacter segetis]
MLLRQFYWSLLIWITDKIALGLDIVKHQHIQEIFIIGSQYLYLFTTCQCSTMQLTLNEVQYISELYEGCLCAACLLELQQEYNKDLR